MNAACTLHAVTSNHRSVKGLFRATAEIQKTTTIEIGTDREEKKLLAGQRPRLNGYL
jgi:hypothetical protein